MTEVEDVTKGERRLAMLAHVLTLTGWIIPLADLLFPALVGWFVQDSDYVRFHARSSLKFQVSSLIYKLLFLILLGGCHLLVRHHDSVDGPSIGLWLLCVALLSMVIAGSVGVVLLVGTVLRAGILAHGGVRYRYSLTLRCLG